MSLSKQDLVDIDDVVDNAVCGLSIIVGMFSLIIIGVIMCVSFDPLSAENFNDQIVQLAVSLVLFIVAIYFALKLVFLYEKNKKRFEDIENKTKNLRDGLNG